MVNVVGLETVLDQETEDQRVFATDLFATNTEIKAYFQDGDEDLSEHVKRLCLDGIREGVEMFKKKYPAPGHKDPPSLYLHSLGYFWHDDSVKVSVEGRLLSDAKLNERWGHPTNNSMMECFCDQISRTVSSQYLSFVDDKWNKSNPSPQ